VDKELNPDVTALLFDNFDALQALKWMLMNLEKLMVSNPVKYKQQAECLKQRFYFFLFRLHFLCLCREAFITRHVKQTKKD